MSKLRTFKGCAGGTVVSALYCHVEIMGSIPGQGENYMDNSISVALPAHSAVISRLGLHLVVGKTAREWLAIDLLMPGLETGRSLNTFYSNWHWAHGCNFNCFFLLLRAFKTAQTPTCHLTNKYTYRLVTVFRFGNLPVQSIRCILPSLPCLMACKRRKH